MLQEPSSWAWVTEVTAGDQALGRGCTLPRGARHPVHLQVGGQQSWRIGEAGPLVPTPPRERAPARLPSAWNVHCAGSLATRLSHPCRPRPTARGPHSWARSLHRPPRVSSSPEPSPPLRPAPGSPRPLAQAGGGEGRAAPCHVLPPGSACASEATAPGSQRASFPLQPHLGPPSRKCGDCRESHKRLWGWQGWGGRDGKGAWVPGDA